MNITQDLIEAALLKCAAKQPSIFEIIQSDRTVPFEPKMDEIEVLGYDGVGRAREVEREGILHGTQVVKFEDEVLGEVSFGSPDDPTYSDVRQAEFMTGCVNRDNTGDLEIPQMLWSSEGRHEGSRSTSYVDRDRVTSSSFIFVKKICDLLNGLVMPRIGT